jgi:hypothetical protein
MNLAIMMLSFLTFSQFVARLNSGKPKLPRFEVSRRMATTRYLFAAKLTKPEHAVAKAGEDASRFVEAYHAAALVAFQTTVKSSTAAFINPEDIHDLMQIAGRHPAVRQLRTFSVPSFAKVFGRGYEDAINSARMLPVISSQLIEAADTIPGKLSVSIPDPWL